MPLVGSGGLKKEAAKGGGKGGSNRSTRGAGSAVPEPKYTLFEGKKGKKLGGKSPLEDSGKKPRGTAPGALRNLGGKGQRERC